jgi:hypothetical protein
MRISSARNLSPVEVARRKSGYFVMRNAKADIHVLDSIATKTASVDGVNKDSSAGSLNMDEELDILGSLAML